ncbi:type II secretion system F family protein [Leifsonia sp. NPDC058248]|uniref:type II secretion system F family protein n=1 Tax=Leifsonia sp. NPDC058248 TaxID=3346402 RepID=UPI0036D96A22
MTAEVRRNQSREADAAAETVEGLATLLEAGVAPESAWHHLGEFDRHPVVAAIAEAVGGGLRPVEAIGRAVANRRVVANRRRPPPITGASRRDDVGSWRALGAAWAVADAAGAALAPSLRQLAVSARDRAETDLEIEVALAGPLATARLVAWLPAVGLGLGVMMGADVLGTLVGSPIGWGLLGAGIALVAVGRLWTRALTRQAASSGGTPGLQLDLTAVALTGGVSVERAGSLVHDACSRFGIDGAEPTELHRTLALAERAGAPVVELLRSAARKARRDARIEGKQRAAALAVRLMMPLGVCVLPSFMLLGVAPIVLTIVSSTVSAI